MNKIVGKVKWFNDAKGYGFISTEKSEFFVHYSEITTGSDFRTLEEGQEVEFVPAEGPRGMFAQNVAVVL